MEPRLAAILIADVVGYSRLNEIDEHLAGSPNRFSVYFSGQERNGCHAI